VRAFFHGLKQASPNRVLLDVMPFFRIAFAGSQISIEIVHLPNWRLNREHRRNSPRTHALPHLYPLYHTPCANFRSRKEMHVIGHKNVIAYPPAVTIGGAFPDFTQNRMAVWRSENSSSLISTRRKEDNRIVTKRRHMC